MFLKKYLMWILAAPIGTVCKYSAITGENSIAGGCQPSVSQIRSSPFRNSYKLGFGIKVKCRMTVKIVVMLHHFKVLFEDILVKLILLCDLVKLCGNLRDMVFLSFNFIVANCNYLFKSALIRG